jgi:hypothetical protein
VAPAAAYITSCVREACEADAQRRRAAGVTGAAAPAAEEEADPDAFDVFDPEELATLCGDFDRIGGARDRLLDAPDVTSVLAGQAMIPKRDRAAWLLVLEQAAQHMQCVLASSRNRPGPTHASLAADLFAKRTAGIDELVKLERYDKMLLNKIKKTLQLSGKGR